MRVSIFASVLMLGLSFFQPGAFAQAVKKQEPLARRFETVFMGEFEDPKAARAAWNDYGGKALANAENDLYPPVSYELFQKRALDRIRQARESRPDASPELLSFVALDGLAAQPKRNVAIAIVQDKSGKTPQGIVVTSIIGEVIPGPGKKAAPKASYRANKAELPVPVLEIPVLTRETVSKALKKSLAGHKGPIVLDLRGNFGGLLTEVPAVASLFLAPNSKVLILETKGGEQEVFRTGTGASMAGISKTLVLIDETTNSGALALAVALKESGEAVIAGTRAPSIKDSIESFTLPRKCPPKIRKCALRLPVGRILSPSGVTYEEAVTIDYPADWTVPGRETQIVSKWLAGSN